MFGYLNQIYDMNPANFTSDYNVALNIQRGVDDLDRISHDIHDIRNSIWMNQFMMPFFSYGYVEETYARPFDDSNIRKRLDALEANKEIETFRNSIVEKWSELSKLYKSTFARTQEIELLMEELKRIGIWFLSDMGWDAFISDSREDLKACTNITKDLLKPLSKISDGVLKDKKFINLAEKEILPSFERLSSLLADLDLRMEIGVGILKGCIALKRLGEKELELREETGPIREQTERNELELPFNFKALDKANNALRVEIDLMISEGKECKSSAVLLSGEHEEMKAWASRIEYRVQRIHELLLDNISRLNDLRRLYELHWSKK